MKYLYHLIFRLLAILITQRLELQQQLVEAQQQLIKTQLELDESRKLVISLQRKLSRKTPENPKDKEAIWHLWSGMFSEEAANSTDVATVRKYRDWLTDKFGKKYIKPYVSPKVYMECLNHMTRGLSLWIAELQTREEMGYPTSGQLADGRPSLMLIRSGR